MSAFGEELSNEIDLTKDSNQSDGKTYLQGEAVYAMNMALLTTLEEGEKQDARYKKLEKLYRKAGPYIAASPFVAANSILLSPLSNNIEGYAKLEIELFSGIGSLIVGALMIHAHDKTREKAHEKAQNALPISHSLNNMTQPWIARRLDEIEADELRRKRMRGEAI